MSFSGKWFSKLRKPLLLPQGTHTVRFAVVPTAWSGKWAGRFDQSIPWQTRLVSNPVEIEVHTPDAEYEAAMRAAGGPDEVPRDGPALAELGGSYRRRARAFSMVAADTPPPLVKIPIHPPAPSR